MKRTFEKWKKNNKEKEKERERGGGEGEGERREWEETIKWNWFQES